MSTSPHTENGTWYEIDDCSAAAASATAAASTHRFDIKDVRCVALDFDGTAIEGNSLSSAFAPETNERYQLAPIVCAVIRWFHAHGVAVFIVSFSKRENIERSLRVSVERLPLTCIADVITPASLTCLPAGVVWQEGFVPPPGYSKNALLGVVLTRTGLEREQVLLVDDNYMNVHHAQLGDYKVAWLQSGALRCALDTHIPRLSQSIDALSADEFYAMWARMFSATMYGLPCF